MRKKFLFLLLIVFLLVLISGCKKCPSSCSDGNECTTDDCGEHTNYECTHKIIDGCTCGDTECDKDIGENKCTCPSDCGKCSGEINNYVEMSCVNDECVTALKDDVKIVTQTEKIDMKSSRFQVDLKLTYDNPMNIVTTPIEFVFRLDDLSEEIDSLFITGISISDLEGIFMGETLFNEPLVNIGDTFTKEIDLSGYSNVDPRNEKKLSFEIAYEYDKKTSSGIDTIREKYKGRTGGMLVINADSN